MTSFDMFNNRVPFGLLSEEEQKALKGWEGGWESYCINGRWEGIPNPNWSRTSTYRAKPIPIIKPSINWDHVSKEFNWLAVDQNGETYLYTCEPTLVEERYWIAKNGPAMPAKYFSSCSRGNVPWQDSLVQRPVKDEDLI